MIIKLSAFIIFISLSFIQKAYSSVPIIHNHSSMMLSLDEAYLIMRNINYSDSIALFGNKVICEKCDLERMIVVEQNQNSTQIINTKYAYSLELRSPPSNASTSCQIASYKFAEHGTYMLDIMSVNIKQNRCTFSIEQTGKPSHYWTPVIVGILFLVIYVILTELWHQVYQRECFDYFGSNSSDKKLINKNLAEKSVNLERNRGQRVVNEINANDNGVATNTSSLALHSPKPLSNESNLKRKFLPNRLRALDTFRGFALMVMIFVNYGGMCSNCIIQGFDCIAVLE